MTLKIPIPIQEMVTMAGSLRFGGIDYADTTIRETMLDDKVYVAVTGKDPESKSSLLWAIKNTGGKEFCIVYVQSIHISSLQMLKEKTKAHKNLDKYLHMCRNMQISAEKICVEMESVEKGLLHLITNSGVKKLVMGAAADKHYSMNMRDLQSKKAIYIRNEAPATCQIWFTCKGYLICSREARRRDNLYLESGPSSSVFQSEITGGTTNILSSSMIKDDNRIRVTVKEVEDLKKKACFEASKRKEAEEAARIEASKRKKAEEAVLFQTYKRYEAEEAARFQESKRIEAEEVARLEASKLKEAEETARFEASLRKEAVKSAKDAIKRAEQSESSHYEEWNRRRETEEALSRATEQLEKTRSESENQIEKFNKVIRKLQGKYSRLRDKHEVLKRELGLSNLKSKDEEEEEASSSSTKRKPPEYFICPIRLEVMEDPHVAADGYTYEREAIIVWFESGGETSPLTNKRLPHTSLVPNRALRSAIKEWRQTSSS